MNLTVLYIVVAICVPLALLLCLLLFVELRRMMAVTKLYSEEGRDLRFVCALLRHYLPGGKWRILRNPCILSNATDAPPRADLLIIGGGGLLVLTVDDRSGHFVTPPTGDWTLWQGKGHEKVANRFNDGRKYIAVLNGLVVRAGLSCPVINLLILSDDEATADDLYSENVLTCNQLIPYLKRFCKGRMLSTSKQKKLRELLAAHHVRCRKALEQVEQPVYNPVFTSVLQDDSDYTADSLFEDASDGNEAYTADTDQVAASAQDEPKTTVSDGGEE